MQVSRNGISNEPLVQPGAQPAVQPQGTPATQAGSGQGVSTTPAFSHGEDTASLSPAANSAASLIARALAGDAAQPAKVSQITAAIGDGSYRVDSDQLASTLIATMLETDTGRRAAA